MLARLGRWLRAAGYDTAIAESGLADTGIKIEYITATTDDVTKRVITQPNSFDVLDTEYFSLKKLVPSGNIFALDAKRIKEFDNILPIPNRYFAAFAAWNFPAVLATRAADRMAEQRCGKLGGPGLAAREVVEERADR